MKKTLFSAICLIFLAACHFNSNAVFLVKGTVTPGLPIHSDVVYTLCLRADVDGIWDVYCSSIEPDAHGNFSKSFSINDPAAPASLVDITQTEFRARLSVAGRPAATQKLNVKITKTQVKRTGGTIEIEISP